MGIRHSFNLKISSSSCMNREMYPVMLYPGKSWYSPTLWRLISSLFEYCWPRRRMIIYTRNIFKVTPHCHIKARVHHCSCCFSIPFKNMQDKCIFPLSFNPGIIVLQLSLNAVNKYVQNIKTYVKNYDQSMSKQT